jgi:Cytochrome P460
MCIGKRGWWRAGIVVLIGAAAFMAYAPPGTTQYSAPPQYDSSGNLLRPVGFETWVFVGSNFGLAYESTSDQPEFHNVYMSPQAYAEFAKTKIFPDKTVFVIDRLTAGDRNEDPTHELKAGQYNDKRLGILAAVKDLNHPHPVGSTTPWAYYVFSMEGDKMPDSTPAQDAANCENCHAKVNANTDNVWVPFYPILRNLMK